LAITRYVIDDMAFQTAKMGLFDWNTPNDPYSYGQLSQNWQKVDFHDHTPGRGSQLSSNSFQDHSVTGSKIALSSIEPDNIDPTGTINGVPGPWIFDNVEVVDDLTAANLVVTGTTTGTGYVSSGSIQIETAMSPPKGFGVFDTSLNWLDGSGTYTTNVHGTGAGWAGVLSLQSYNGWNYIGTQWNQSAAPVSNLVAMQWQNDPNSNPTGNSQANVTFPNNVAVGGGLSFPSPGVTGYLLANQLDITGGITGTTIDITSGGTLSGSFNLGSGSINGGTINPTIYDGGNGTGSIYTGTFDASSSVSAPVIVGGTGTFTAGSFNDGLTVSGGDILSLLVNGEVQITEAVQMNSTLQLTGGRLEAQGGLSVSGANMQLGGSGTAFSAMAYGNGYIYMPDGTQYSTSSQNHGLGLTPNAVFMIPTNQGGGTGAQIYVFADDVSTFNDTSFGYGIALNTPVTVDSYIYYYWIAFAA
jgi:hypothetical protein